MSESVRMAIDQFARVALVARALTAKPAPSEVVDIVVRQGMAGLDAEGGVLAFLDTDGVLVPAVAVGYSKEAIAAFTPLSIERDLPLTAAARTNEAVWVESRQDAQARFPDLLAGSVTGSQAWAAIPLVVNDSMLGVLGLSFLAPRSFSEDERLFISTLADLSALALADRANARSAAVSSTVRDSSHRRSADDQLAPPLEGVVNQLFRATLTLASILGARRVDDDVADRLHHVIGELDVAVRRCQRASLACALPDQDSEPTTNRSAVPEEPGPIRVGPGPAGPVDQQHAARTLRRRCLCRFDDGEVFAYARGHDYFRASDHALWAHESNGVLLSGRTSAPIARRVGKAFFDVDTNAPIYYQRAN